MGDFTVFTRRHFAGKSACWNGVVTNARDPRAVIQASGLYDAQ
jgi:hypothetical protein